jgi:hypothetical protein
LSKNTMPRTMQAVFLYVYSRRIRKTGPTLAG